MKVNLEPESARAYIPFVLKLEDVSVAPKIEVRAENEAQSFILPGVTKEGDSSYRAQFALEHPGEYELVIKTGTETKTVPFVVEPQIFMNFTKEFGTFTVLFLILMTGVVFWVAKIKKREKAKQTAS